MPWTLVGNLSPQITAGSPIETYTRPNDWLPLPTITTGEQKLAGLYAIYPYEGTTFAALSAAGNYTVDWGDGTPTENLPANTQANHQYDYNTLPANTSTDRGYRQAIITITPQAGQTLTTLDIGRKHTRAGLPGGYVTGWLDVRTAAASLTSIRLAADTGSTSVVSAGLLEQFEYIGPSSITNISYLFSNCYNLRSIKGPQFTAQVSTASGWISGCTALRTLADLNLSKLTNAANWCANNRALQQVLNIDLRLVGSALSAFENCTSLLEATNINIASAGTASNMFQSCTALRTVSGINAPAATNFNGMFNGCTTLRSVTGLTTTSGTDFGNMFQSCPSLRNLDVFDTTNATATYSMFSGCHGLQTIPTLNLAKVTAADSMFSGNTVLIGVPALNLTLATASLVSLVAGCPSLSHIGVVNVKNTLSVANCRLSSAALDTLYTNLGSAVKTLTVTGNYGTTADNPTIATSKGWTVTGT